MLAIDLASKPVVCVEPELSLLEASQIMKEAHVGSLVIVDSMDLKKPIGILTDRDIVLKIADKYPLSISLDQVMSKRLVTISETEDLDSALDKMKYHGIRRLVVVDRQGLAQGILTTSDVLRSGMCSTRDLNDLIQNQPQQEGLKQRTRMC